MRLRHKSSLTMLQTHSQAPHHSLGIPPTPNAALTTQTTTQMHPKKNVMTILAASTPVTSLRLATNPLTMSKPMTWSPSTTTTMLLEATFWATTEVSRSSWLKGQFLSLPWLPTHAAMATAITVVLKTHNPQDTCLTWSTTLSSATLDLQVLLMVQSHSWFQTPHPQHQHLHLLVIGPATAKETLANLTTTALAQWPASAASATELL